MDDNNDDDYNDDNDSMVTQISHSRRRVWLKNAHNLQAGERKRRKQDSTLPISTVRNKTVQYLEARLFIRRDVTTT